MDTLRADPQHRGHFRRDSPYLRYEFATAQTSHKLRQTFELFPCAAEKELNLIINLTGRTAIVTGSSAGIGRAIAEGLARAGASVVINGRRAERVTAAVEEIGQLFLTRVSREFVQTSRPLRALPHSLNRSRMPIF